MSEPLPIRSRTSSAKGQFLPWQTVLGLSLLSLAFLLGVGLARSAEIASPRATSARWLCGADLPLRTGPGFLPSRPAFCGPWRGGTAMLSAAVEASGLFGASPRALGSRWPLLSAVAPPLLIGLAVVALLALLAALGRFALPRLWPEGIVFQRGLLERKIQEATEALAESEERFQLAMRGTDAGIWDWDLRTNRVYFSPRWKSILGYTEEEIGAHFSEWERRLHPEDRARAHETLQRFFSGETPSYEFEHRLRHKDGSYRWILARGMALRDATGRPYRMVGSHIEVTDRKRAEERLQETAEALRRSNQDLEQFASIASHDLQEPLRMLSAYLDAIARQYREYLPSQAHALIDLSTQTGQRMQQLIHDLLTYSRVSTRALESRPVDCNEVLSEALRNLRLTLEEQAATVTSAPLPVVLGDRTQLVQLFQNLLGNGIKFHGDTPPRVQVTAEPNGSRWKFAIRDNGIGIESQYAETVFEIFQRLHPSDIYPGTGIGLAICKRIIDRHEGRIWFESTVGQGTTFFFTLPALEAQAAVA